MLFKALKSMIAKQGMTAELEERINVLYAAGKLTTEEYEELMGMA